MKNNVRRYRKEKGWTQKELSEKTRISRNTISKLENDKVDVITNITMERLARALGVTQAQLFEH